MVFYFQVEGIDLKTQNTPLLSLDLIVPAIKSSFLKLNPFILYKNPVMFVVAIGSIITTICAIFNIINHIEHEIAFSIQISIWLWFTVLFANFAEALAEGRGKAQAESLKKHDVICKQVV